MSIYWRESIELAQGAWHARHLRWLTFEELDHRAAAFDAAASSSPEVDYPCSTSDWVLPAAAAFLPKAEPRILETDAGWVALAALPLAERHHAVVPLEPVWQLASPFVGSEPEQLVDALFEERSRVLGDGATLVLSGLAVGGRAFRAVERRFSSAHRVGTPQEPIGRCVASLEGGLDGFLRRRSAKFRATVGRAHRLALRDGVRFEYLRDFPSGAVEGVIDRIVRIEKTSWKGLSGTGMDAEPGQGFYRRIADRLARRGALRVLFGSRGEEDVCFVFGGLFGSIYRGHQASFDHRFAHSSLGAASHLEMIARLCGEGVGAYDLGSDMLYKRRWGEGGLTTTALFVFP
jgi:hypothetical protein